MTRVRTLQEIDSNSIHDYIYHGLYSHDNNKDFWTNSSKKIIRDMLDELDVNDALKVIDEYDIDHEYVVEDIPKNTDLLYKLLGEKKVKIIGYLVDQLDVDCIDYDDVDGKIEYDTCLIKFGDKLVSYVSVDDDNIEEYKEAYDNGADIRIYIIHPDDGDDVIPLEKYVEMVRRLYNIGVRVTDDTIKDMLRICSSYTKIGYELALELLDMGYELTDDIKINDISGRDIYERLLPYIHDSSIIYYSLRTDDRDVDTRSCSISLTSHELIHKLHQRDDIMELCKGRIKYKLDGIEGLNSHDLHLVYITHKTSIRSLEQMIVLLNEYDVDVDINKYAKLSSIPLDYKIYETGLRRLWKIGHDDMRVVKMFLTYYRTLLSHLTPRIKPHKFIVYNGYPNVMRSKQLSDVQIVSSMV